MKAQAIDDLIYVCEYIDRNKIRNEDIRKLRTEATKKRAKERGVAVQTVHRNLALGIDKKKNIDSLDQMLQNHHLRPVHHPQ